MMGMQLPEDEQYLWIAEESLLAPLPEGELLLHSGIRCEGEPGSLSKSATWTGIYNSK